MRSTGGLGVVVEWRLVHGFEIIRFDEADRQNHVYRTQKAYQRERGVQLVELMHKDEEEAAFVYSLLSTSYCAYLTPYARNRKLLQQTSHSAVIICVSHEKLYACDDRRKCI